MKLVGLVCPDYRGSGGRIAIANRPVRESSPGELIAGSHPHGKDAELITAADGYGFNASALPFDPKVTCQQWQLNRSGCGAMVPGVDDHVRLCVVGILQKKATASVAVADVPVGPLDPFGTGSTETGTFAALLLKALKGDG